MTTDVAGYKTRDFDEDNTGNTLNENVLFVSNRYIQFEKLRDILRAIILMRSLFYMTGGATVLQFFPLPDLIASDTSARIISSHFVLCVSVNDLIVATKATAAFATNSSPTSVFDQLRHAHKCGSMLACVHVRVSGISNSRLMPRCG